MKTEEAIRLHLGKLPGVVVEGVKAQADYFIISIHHKGVVRAFRAKNAKEALAEVKRKCDFSH